MGLNVASVKSYVSSALTTTLFGSGVGEREVGKLTSIIMNKMLFAQGGSSLSKLMVWRGQTSLLKTLPTTITASNMKRLKSAEGISFNQRSVRQGR